MFLTSGYVHIAYVLVKLGRNVASDFLISAWGLSYGLSKSKRGIKSSLNFERS